MTHAAREPDRYPRWLFLRALALIFFSAFYSLVFQIKGLIGPEGILPAQHYLANAAQQLDLAQLLGLERYLVRAIALLDLVWQLRC